MTRQDATGNSGKPKRFKSVSKLPWTAAAVAVVLLAVAPALAHRVNIFAWIEDGTVYTESKFSGGKQAKHASVEVFDAQGKRLLAGKTDDQGLFSFPMPRKQNLKIVLTAGMGHRAVWHLTEQDYGDAAAVAPNPERPLETSAAPLSSQRMSEDAAALDAQQTAALQQLVEAALDKKLAPVMKRLATLQADAPSLTDIIGGIGYIFGLVGVAAFFHSKRKDSDAS